MTDLRSALRDHYESQELRPEVEERLLEHAVARRRERGARWRLWVPATAVAALILAAFLLRDSVVGLRGADALARSVAAEISLNHHKSLEPEFRSEDFAELGARMDRLGFTLVRPARIAESGAQLVGARYCSLGGWPAAQVQLRDDRDRRQTLYEVPLTGDLERVKGGAFEIDGLGVTLWREKGLLVGWARPLE